MTSKQEKKYFKMDPQKAINLLRQSAGWVRTVTKYWEKRWVVLRGKSPGALNVCVVLGEDCYGNPYHISSISFQDSKNLCHYDVDFEDIEKSVPWIRDAVVKGLLFGEKVKTNFKYLN